MCSLEPSGALNKRSHAAMHTHTHTHTHTPTVRVSEGTTARPPERAQSSVSANEAWESRQVGAVCVCVPVPTIYMCVSVPTVCVSVCVLFVPACVFLFCFTVSVCGLTPLVPVLLLVFLDGGGDYFGDGRHSCHAAVEARFIIVI